MRANGLAFEGDAVVPIVEAPIPDDEIEVIEPAEIEAVFLPLERRRFEIFKRCLKRLGDEPSLSLRDIADEFGVSQVAVFKVWKQVTRAVGLFRLYEQADARRRSSAPAVKNQDAA